MARFHLCSCFDLHSLPLIDGPPRRHFNLYLATTIIDFVHLEVLVISSPQTCSLDQNQTFLRKYNFARRFRSLLLAYVVFALIYRARAGRVP